ncbi:MAG: molecular chaperone DnaJ [Bacilli bacterium]|nr:molecular chaperone DnaJ [Bacilli bacterium]
MANKRDYYDVLGVGKSASKDEIKSAYRKLAKQYHPDVNHDADAPEKFKEVQEAYDVLYDDQKRGQYDQFGHAAFEQGGSTGGAGPFGQGFSSQGFGDVDLSDIFNSFFGGGRRSSSQQSGPTKGEDTLTRVRINFMDAVNGKKISLRATFDENCSHCHGTGAENPGDTETCSYCGGRGYVTRNQRTIFGTMQQQETCAHCKGSGRIVRNPCKTCGGNGYARVTRDLTVNIPAGINSGQQIRVQGKGYHGSNGGPTGDLYVEVLVAEHAQFKRDGNDVHLEVPLSFVDCALGCTIEVPTVYGEVQVKIPAGTQPNEILKLKERGIKDLRSGRPGNEYLHIVVKTPTRLNRAQKELLESFQKQTDKRDNEFDKWKESFVK